MSRSSLADLPEFRKHGGDTKFVPLTAGDIAASPRHIDQYLSFLAEWTRTPFSQLTVLDLGCGRGEMVAALRKKGARAFGIEIDLASSQADGSWKASIATTTPYCR